MATDVDPIVGSWYQLLDKSQPFEVISLDEDIGLVEIQYLDGDQEELDLDTWYELDVEPTDAPEEWVGSIDDLEESGRYAETHEETWSGPSGKRRRREWEDTDVDEDEDNLNKDDVDEERWDLDDED
ncbi:MAG: DUF6763 family protein [Candidatus Competibacteraceae bacterium]